MTQAVVMAQVTMWDHQILLVPMKILQLRCLGRQQMLTGDSHLWLSCIYTKMCFIFDCSFIFAFRVPATYDQGILPNTLRRIKFLPVRQPSAHVEAVLQSDMRRFSRLLIFFSFVFYYQGDRDCARTQINTPECAFWIDRHTLDMTAPERKSLHWRCWDLLESPSTWESSKCRDWQTMEIFSGLLPRNITLRDHFLTLLSFSSVGDPEEFAAAASVGNYLEGMYPGFWTT